MTSLTPEYGIGVARNRFALVDLEEVDPLELLERTEKEREEKKKAKLAEKDNKAKQVPAPKPKTQKILKETQKKSVSDLPKPKEERKPKKEVNFAENRSGNNRDQGKENSWHDEDAAVPDRGNAEERGPSYSSDGFQRGRGGGGRRGGAPRGSFARGSSSTRGGPRGGGQRFDTRNKREYDRQSGSDKTGVKSVDKRDGSGSHNWGSTQDDVKAPQEDDWATPQDDDWNIPRNEDSAAQQPIESYGQTGTQENVGPAATEGEPGNESAKEIEGGTADLTAEDAEKKEMTLDEWKALKKSREQPKYNIRKPGEGEDLTQWKKMFELQKKKEGEEDDEEYEYEYGLYPQRVGRQKRIYDIDIKFKDRRGDERGRGFGRGGRGRGAGGRGGGGFRNRDQSPAHNDRKDREHSAPAPKVDDEKDFPSLA